MTRALNCILGFTPTLLLFVLVLVSGRSLAAIPEAPTSPRAMVVTAHPEATKAGLEILKAGGNAVDAAVAVAFALSVCEPHSSGIGGGGFSLVFDAKANEVLALDGRETAPLNITEALFHPGGEYKPDLSRFTGLAVGVPGLVRQMHTLHSKYGKRPFAELLQPAIRLARDGFAITPLLQRKIDALADRMSPGARKIFLHKGTVPPAGWILKQADLAVTLESIAKVGPEGFYKGHVASKIAETVRTYGGVMTEADMAGYEARWRKPIRGEWAGMNVYSFPPPSSGGAVLVRMLHGVGEGKDLKDAGWNSAYTVHILSELMKRAYADRNLLLADPDFVDVPIERFEDPKAGRKDRKAIRTKATPSRKILDPKKLKREGTHTSHFSIVDAEGNAVSQTQTINLTFGSAIVADGTGVVLNNEMDDFSTSPGRANAFGLVQGTVNAVAPKKRPLSSMTPTIIVRNDEVEVVVGSPGGSFIINAVFQTILNRFLFKMKPGEAVCMPRFHHQWLPDYIMAERFALSPDTISNLGRKRHLVREVGNFSNVQAIFRTDSGWAGAPDCRGDGTAAGH